MTCINIIPAFMHWVLTMHPDIILSIYISSNPKYNHKSSYCDDKPSVYKDQRIEAETS